EVIAGQVGLGELGQPVRLDLSQPAAQLRPDPGEPGAVRTTQPFEADADKRIDRRGLHVYRSYADRLRTVDDEEDTPIPAHLTQSVEIGHVAGERVDPSDTEDPRVPADRRRKLVSGDHTVAWANAPYPHAEARFEGKPGEDVRGEVA